MVVRKQNQQKFCEVLPGKKLTRKTFHSPDSVTALFLTGKVICSHPTIQKKSGADSFRLAIILRFKKILTD
jgi:hypothetical protein